MLLVQRPVPSTRDTRYMLQFGGVLTPTQFLENANEIQDNYFRGGMMRLQYEDPSLGLSNLDQQVSRDYAIPYDLLEPSMDITAAIPFTNWTHNFLRLDVARPGLTNMLDPASVDDFINNIRVAARAAFNVGYKGLILDMEAYSSSALWNWTLQPAGPSFADYQAAYLAAGSIAINAIEQEFKYRAAEIIIAISYEQLKNITTLGQLEVYRYGLLPKFLDGLHDNATTSRLTCMCEDSYVNKTAADMDYDIALQTPPGVPWLGSLNYSNVHLNGLSTWLDANGADVGGQAFSYTFPASNYFTPEGFQNALELMIPRVDKYCVVYTDAATRWPGMVRPGTDAVPDQYVQTLNNMIYSSSAGWMLG